MATVGYLLYARDERWSVIERRYARDLRNAPSTENIRLLGFRLLIVGAPFVFLSSFFWIWFARRTG
jgi:hypothetical protein